MELKSGHKVRGVVLLLLSWVGTGAYGIAACLVLVWPLGAQPLSGITTGGPRGLEETLTILPFPG